jgi:hypothetical protein
MLSLQRKKRRSEIFIDNFAPSTLRQLFDRTRRDGVAAGIGNEDVHRTERPFNLPSDPFDVLEACGVADRDNRAPRTDLCLDRALNLAESLRIAAMERNHRAVFGEQTRDRSTDSPRAPRHQCHLSTQCIHAISPTTR